MQELNHEKLSLFIDNQLDVDQSLRLLKSVQNDADLQAKLKRYALISQAIKGESCVATSSSFVERIHEEIRKEPTYLIPNRKPALDWKKTAWAVAASILLGASVVSFITVEKLTKPFGSVQTVSHLSVQSRPDSNAKFKEYLQDHDNVWYVNNTVDAQPYARVAGFKGR